MATAARYRLPTDVVMLAAFLLATFGAAAIGSWLTMQGMPQWYASLAKPSFNPPDWIFGPVWTLLYLFMAIAAWLIWRTAGPGHRILPLALFAGQLLLNVAWSGIFFALRSPGGAFAEIVLLWAAILATLVAFWRVNTIAGVLFVPYLVWVTFAAFLNYSIWRLN